MFKKILLILVALAIIFSIVVAMQPADYRVERSTTIAAPAADVFAHVNDFHKWEAWSPWLKIDPNAKNSYEGPTSGKDAAFKWSGNSEVGEGKMTITESRPNELIKIRLDFIRPMEATSDVEFTFKPQGDQTAVTWSMAGKNGFLFKAIHLVMNCEKMIGDKYEEGLANLKAVVEKAPKVAAKG
jgi:uncharacterized protein YndB with AHSA1/START domain